MYTDQGIIEGKAYEVSQFKSTLSKDIEIYAFTSSIGNISLDKKYDSIDFKKIEESIVRCPDEKVSGEMISSVKSARKQGDTLGGVITCVIKNTPIGLGEPVFNKLHSELGKAMLSINAVKGFEYGSGFAGASRKGSAHNDLYNEDGTTKTNYSYIIT